MSVLAEQSVKVTWEIILQWKKTEIQGLGQEIRLTPTISENHLIPPMSQLCNWSTPFFQMMSSFAFSFMLTWILLRFSIFGFPDNYSTLIAHFPVEIFFLISNIKAREFWGDNAKNFSNHSNIMYNLRYLENISCCIQKESYNENLEIIYIFFCQESRGQHCTGKGQTTSILCG